jgi:hypothetical protein
VIENRRERVWILVAAIAIMAALALMLVAQAQSGHTVNWLAILPVLFIGLIAPRTLLTLACDDAVGKPSTPALHASFERPPPFGRA